MSNEEKLQSLQRWQPALHMVGDQPFAGMDAEDYGEYVDYEAVVELFESLCNSPEIDQIKPEPPAPAAMGADKFLKETALYIAEATQHKHRALSSSGVEDYFRHYGDLRAREGLLELLRLYRGATLDNDLIENYLAFKSGNTTKG